MCKMGDYYLYLDVDEKIGIKSVLSLPVAKVKDWGE